MAHRQRVLKLNIAIENRKFMLNIYSFAMIFVVVVVVFLCLLIFLVEYYMFRQI